jgi:hypothetical protein
LGVGITSPTQKLDVYGTGMKVNNASYVGYLGAGNTFAGGAASDFCVRSDNVLSFATGGPYERARIDSSGNLLVGGTTSPSGKANNFVNLGGSGGFWTKSGGVGYFGTFDNYAMVFATNDTERARIDSSGNLLVGTTSTSGATGFAFISPSASSVQRLIIGHVVGNTTGDTYHEFNYNSSQIGSITQSGTTAVLYNTTSDQRLKENIEDADSASNLIDSLQVRQFDWITDKTHQRYGFVAQELVTVAPEAVNQPNDPEEMMAVDYSKLVPMLVKEIQSLRQRLSAANL